MGRGVRVANAVGWAALAVLGLGALLLAKRFGFVGLIVIGGGVAFVCSQASAREQTPPGYGNSLGANGRLPSPEERAAMASANQPLVALLRFYQRCGLALIAVGAAGFASQLWFGGD